MLIWLIHRILGCNISRVTTIFQLSNSTTLHYKTKNFHDVSALFSNIFMVIFLHLSINIVYIGVFLHYKMLYSLKKNLLSEHHSIVCLKT